MGHVASETTFDHWKALLIPDFELLDSLSTHHLPISKKIHRDTFKIPDLKFNKSHSMFLPLVIGPPQIHTGATTAGVVGSKMPRYVI